VSGTINIDKNGDAIKTVIVAQVKDGKFVFASSIEPEDLQ